MDFETNQVCNWGNRPTTNAVPLTEVSAAYGPTCGNAFAMSCETYLGLVTDPPVSFGIHLNPCPSKQSNELAYTRDRGGKSYAFLLLILGHSVPKHSDGRPTECYGGGKAHFTVYAELLDGSRRQIMAPVMVSATEKVKKRVNIGGNDIRNLILITSPGPAGHLWCNSAFWGEPYLIPSSDESNIPSEYS